MEMNFCRRCGEPLKNVRDHIYKCRSGHTIYANANPCVGIFFITPSNDILLAVRNIEPNKGMLDSIGGFVDGKETFEQAITRELEEEVGVKPPEYEALNYFTSVADYYPYQGENVLFLTSYYWTRLVGSSVLKPGDDVERIEAMPMDNVDFDRMHNDATRKALERLITIFTSKGGDR